MGGIAGPAHSAGSVLGIIQQACATSPSEPAIIFEDGLELSRGQLLEGSEIFASYLGDRIEPGDRVAIMLGNRAEYFIAWLAVIANRASLVSINPGSRGHDAGHVLADSGARILITDAEHRSLAGELRASSGTLRETIEVSDAEPNGLSGYRGARQVSLLSGPADPDDIVSVYYTSGTTGSPKGCMLSHRFWLRFVDLYLHLYGLQPGDRLLCWFQFYYLDPPWMLLASLLAGTPLVVMRNFSVSRFWSTVVRHDVTVLFGSASVPLLLIAREPAAEEARQRVRYCVHVGIPAVVHQDLVDRWGFPWLEGYGMTETGLVIAMPPERGDAMTGSGSIGLPCPDVQIRVVDDADADVQAGQPGQLILKAPGLMAGYLGRPELTSQLFQGGWLHTGDMVRVDEEGFVYFIGRKKDIVRRSGENISATEVEAVLRKHPSVVDAAIVAVPDGLRGEEAKAYVVLADGESQESVPPAELAQLCESELARFKVPRYWAYVAGDLPRTPSMRVRKEELRSAQPLDGVIWDRDQQRVM